MVFSNETQIGKASQYHHSHLLPGPIKIVIKSGGDSSGASSADQGCAMLEVFPESQTISIPRFTSVATASKHLDLFLSVLAGR